MKQLKQLHNLLIYPDLKGYYSMQAYHDLKFIRYNASVRESDNCGYWECPPLGCVGYHLVFCGNE